MKRILFIFLILVFGVGSVFAQKAKPWIEWSDKDAAKILNDSAWGQTQTIGDSGAPTQASAITATQGRPGQDIDRKGESGEMQQNIMHFRVRFLTAKPIREAFARRVLLQQTSPNKDLEAQLQGFIDRDFGNYLVVALSIDGTNARAAAGMMTGLSKITADALKDKVYLERKDGKRIMLSDYKAPTNDGMGAKLIFDRTLDGQPFLTEASESIRFYMELSGKQKIDVRFKTPSMIYGGKLEY